MAAIPTQEYIHFVNCGERDVRGVAVGVSGQQAGGEDFLRERIGFVTSCAIDGNRFINYKKIPHRCIIKGDTLFASIAAASILAKTYRDEYMMNLHQQFPHYSWDCNKGYGTATHRIAIEKLLQEPREIAAMSVAARELALSSFSLDTMGKRLETLYRSILASEPRGRVALAS